MIMQFLAKLLGWKKRTQVLAQPVEHNTILEPNQAQELSMISVNYTVEVVAADGKVKLTYEAEKHTFIPRIDDTIHLTFFPSTDDFITADVVEVLFDPINEHATVYGNTDLDLSTYYSIDEIVKESVQNGWSIDGAIQYHCGKKSCCKLGQECDSQN